MRDSSTVLALPRRLAFRDRLIRIQLGYLDSDPLSSGSPGSCCTNWVPTRLTVGRIPDLIEEGSAGVGQQSSSKLPEAGFPPWVARLTGPGAVWRQDREPNSPHFAHQAACRGHFNAFPIYLLSVAGRAAGRLSHQKWKGTPHCRVDPVPTGRLKDCVVPSPKTGEPPTGLETSQDPKTPKQTPA